MLMQIRELRTQAGLTQVELANSMGVFQSMVSQWEAETSLPPTRRLPDLARLLGCSINDLFVQADDEAC